MENAMKAIKKIICPVDVYAFHPEAVEYALILAQALEAEIYVIYVLEPVPPQYIGEGYSLPPDPEKQEKMKQEARAKMAEVMSRFCDVCRSKGEVVVGSAADKIIQIAEECAGDMIVMASYCRTLVCRAIHGSVTSKVLANSKIPVLVIYPKEQ